MSKVSYDPDSMVIELDGLETTAKALGELKSKTPAAAKVAINATAREARRRMIAAVLDRYAINSKGIKYVKVLKQDRKATNTNLTASLYINTPRNDLAYFDTYLSALSSEVPLMGMRAFSGPDYFKGRVLKASSMRDLTGTAKRSKGFLVRFKSRHVGMVQRVLGSDVSNKAKPTRWRTKDGRVEKLVTLGSPSATAMHHIAFPVVEPDVEQYLQDRLEVQVERVIDRAAAKKGK
jgi:hypothetical protein